MNLDRNFAKDLCEKLGIEWDSSARVPTLRGVPFTENDIRTLFSTGLSISYNANINSNLNVVNSSYFFSDDWTALRCA